MSEIFFGGQQPESENSTYELETKIELKLAETAQALSRFIDNPVEPDPRIKAFRQDQLDWLQSEDGRMASIYKDYYEVKVRTPGFDSYTLPPIYPTNLVLRGIQKIYQNKVNWPAGMRYPHDFTTPQRWHAGVEHILDNDSFRTNLSAEIKFLEIQSNIADRYKSLKLALNLFQDQFHDPSEPHILDVGCSLNLGLQTLATNKNFFRQTKLNIPTSGARPAWGQVRSVKQYLNRPAPFGWGIGVDALGPDDQNIRDWIKSCSFYPSELLSRRRRAYFDDISTINSPKVGFILNDFANPYEAFELGRYETRLPQPGEVEMDVISLFTVAYQVPEEMRQKMLDRARALLGHRGILMVQDFASIDKNDPKKLNFDTWLYRDRDDPWPYKTFVEVRAQPERGFQTFLEWENGRCGKVKLGPLALERLAA